MIFSIEECASGRKFAQINLHHSKIKYLNFIATYRNINPLDLFFHLNRSMAIQKKVNYAPVTLATNRDSKSCIDQREV